MLWTRFLLVALLLAGVARASESIPEPKTGVSPSVQQPHVVAELIAETTHPVPGKPFLVALHLHMDAGWHTYWINPGDAGLATKITWTLPAGFSAGPIQWPTPEKHPMGPLTTYGYGGDVYLLTTITPPAGADEGSPSAPIQAEAEWLVCREECIPGKADLTLNLTGAGMSGAETQAHQNFFTAAMVRLPERNTSWDVSGAYSGTAMTLRFRDRPESMKVGGPLYFFPEQGNVLDAREKVGALEMHPREGFSWPLALQQNGEKPDHLSGVLVSGEVLQAGGVKAVYVASFPVSGGGGSGVVAMASGAGSLGGVGPSTSLRMTEGGAVAGKGSGVGSLSGVGPSTSLRMTEALGSTGVPEGGTSEAIPAPRVGVSSSVKQPHVTAELISEATAVTSKPFLVALHLHMDAGWHTYWINPGDAGLATKIKWTLPAGFTAGPIEWPTPELHPMGPLTTYGYGGDVYLLTMITPPEKMGMRLPIELKAHAEWLVCREECIPGRGDFAIKLGATGNGSSQASEDFFAAAQSRLPAENTRWEVRGSYRPSAMMMMLMDQADGSPKVSGSLYFFPEQGNVLAAREDASKIDWVHPGGGFSWPLGLQQNGEEPGELSGVLVSGEPLLEGGARAVYIASFPVRGAMGSGAGSLGGVGPSTSLRMTEGGTVAMAPGAGSGSGPGPSTSLRMTGVLGAAFLGGLILNLMPCVLPVLSLKVFSLLRHAGEDPRSAWRQGAAFTGGVVLSFWILAGLLIALRAAGNHLGWGFQMQSPGFVLALIFLFFLLGLNLLGVFELGTSLVGLDAKASGHVGSGLTSSFLNGALATLAATPCTAPFMGSSVGFAAGQPPLVAMLIFTFLALGMATPYLLLTLFPGALRFVPKPGAWMETFKQFMGFLLLATVIFLVYVFGALVGEAQIPALLGALLLGAVGAWIYGRRSAWGSSESARADVLLLVVLACGGAIYWGVMLARTSPPPSSVAADGAWQPWTPAAVDSALGSGRPVFVDFTAAWCLSCKVNEQVALETNEVTQAFAEKKVALFRADWTHADPTISAVLERYHRDGVPLYLLYSPGRKDAPEVLPEVLTPGLVVDAVKKA